jgi:hypothetical protein
MDALSIYACAGIALGSSFSAGLITGIALKTPAVRSAALKLLQRKKAEKPGGVHLQGVLKK